MTKQSINQRDLLHSARNNGILKMSSSFRRNDTCVRVQITIGKCDILLKKDIAEARPLFKVERHNLKIYQENSEDKTSRLKIYCCHLSKSFEDW